MKKLVLTLCLVVTATAALAQGTVKFANTSTSLVSVGGASITGAAGSYFFGLLTAPVGTTDTRLFTFTGAYATNTVTGRLQGGPNTGVTVAGWPTDTQRAFLVAGWTANLGHDWNPAWLAGTYLGTVGEFFGLSGIGTGAPGGTDALGNPVPVLVTFGAAPAITAGFGLNPVPVPEPTTLALAGLGAAALLIFRRRN